MRSWSIVAIACVVACGPRDASKGVANGGARADSAGGSGAVERVASVGGFDVPEALVYDSVADVFFVSNIGGKDAARDGNGFISRMSPEGVVQDLHFIGLGKNGVTLDSPMGARVRGDTLWVLDLDRLLAFDHTSGAPLATIDFAPLSAALLNDFDWGPDGAVYVTDMGGKVERNGRTRTIPQRILRAAPNGAPSVALAIPGLDLADGISWDAAGNRFIIAPFGGPNILTWRPGENKVTRVASGAGQFDGIEIQRDGRVLLTSWADSSVLQLTDTTLAQRIHPIVSPADLSMDTRRHRLGVASFLTNTVEIWALPNAPSQP